MGNRWGSSKSAECGACVTTLHASTCLRRDNEEAEEFDTSSTMFQSLKVTYSYSFSLTASLNMVLLTSTPSARHMASTDLYKEVVVSSFTDSCLASSWFPCSSSIRDADNFLYVRHSLQGKISMQTAGTLLLLGCPVAPASGAHSSSGPGQNMGQGRKAEGEAFSFQKHSCVCSC